MIADRPSARSRSCSSNRARRKRLHLLPIVVQREHEGTPGPATIVSQTLPKMKIELVEVRLTACCGARKRTSRKSEIRPCMSQHQRRACIDARLFGTTSAGGVRHTVDLGLQRCGVQRLDDVIVDAGLFVAMTFFGPGFQPLRRRRRWRIPGWRGFRAGRSRSSLMFQSKITRRSNWSASGQCGRSVAGVVDIERRPAKMRMIR